MAKVDSETLGELSPRRDAAAQEWRRADETTLPTLLEWIQPSGMVSGKILGPGSDQIAKLPGVVWQDFWAAEPKDEPDFPSRTLDFDGKWASAPKFLQLPPKKCAATPKRHQGTHTIAPRAPRKAPVTTAMDVPRDSKKQSLRMKTKTFTEILASMEGEVTIMVRNVAINLKQEQLLAELQRLSLASLCNFAYIPCHDSTSSSNSYIFLNFTTAQAGTWLVRQWDGNHLAGISSEGGRALNLSLAQVQGLEANLANLRRRKGSASGQVLLTQ